LIDVLFTADLYDPFNEVNRSIRVEFFMMIDNMFVNFKSYYHIDFSFNTFKFIDDAPPHRKVRQRERREEKRRDRNGDDDDDVT
jgi:hypothetical protein